MLTCVEDENIIDNSLFAVSFSPPKYNQILPKLSRRVAIPSARWLPIDLFGSWMTFEFEVYLDHLPAVVLRFSSPAL